MNLLTFLDAKNDNGIKAVTGVCNTSDEFASYVNTAIRKLARRGDWYSLTQTAKFCTQENCVTFPSFVGHVRAINVCNDPTPIMNHWYEFMQYGQGQAGSNCGSDSTIVFRGRTPVFRNIDCGTTRYIRFYPRCNTDVGKVIRVYGIDENGQELMTKVDGVWSPGIEVVLAAPYVSTSKTFQQVTRISKAETECQVYVYQYDAVNDVLIDMAVYEPGDTEPSYAKYYITSQTGSCCNSTSCSSQRNLLVQFKLNVVPVVNDSDILPIQNLDAIKLMILAAKKETANDFDGARREELAAVKEMNLQDSEYYPDDNIPVSVNPFGSAALSRHRIGSNV